MKARLYFSKNEAKRVRVSLSTKFVKRDYFSLLIEKDVLYYTLTMNIPNCSQHPARPVPAVGAIQYFITPELYRQLSQSVSPQTLRQFQEGWNTGGAMCREDLEAYKQAQEKSGMKTREIGIAEYMTIREGKKSTLEA